MNSKQCLESKKDELFEKIQKQSISSKDAEKEIEIIRKLGEKYIDFLQETKRILAEILSISVEEISEYACLSDLGADLVIVSQLIEKISNQFGTQLELGLFEESMNLVGIIFELVNQNQTMPKVNRSEKIIVQEESLALAKKYVRTLISEVMKIDQNDIEEDCDLDAYGINSIYIMTLQDRIEKDFSGVPKTLFFEYKNVLELAQYFEKYQKEGLMKLFGEENFVEQEETVVKENSVFIKSTQDYSTDIAIVGLAGSYAKAKDVEEFWENLKSGKDCISEIPKERWDYQKYQSKENKKSTVPHWGGFIDDVDKFDAGFFQIAPREAEKMDPQERLFLECVYKTIEDAGYTRKTIASEEKYGKGAKVGVFVGAMFEEYQFYGVSEQAHNNMRTLNGSKSSIANRISYYFNFQGPCVAVDTMCSSSLTALYMAGESLKRGDCEAAIVGGVNLSIHPNKYIALSEDNFLASDGRCRSYGEDGDGYVPGEGVGAILIKRLDEAKLAGDHIYAVIKGGAINHGGKTNGYSVPNPNAMSDLIENVLHKTKIDPRTIGYVEGHGTGTSLGDPIEIAGLNKVYNEYTKDKQYCAIGSVKSNIGHCEGAAGIASLTKILLQFKHKQLVPSLHSEKLNSNIPFEDSPFYVPQELQSWKRITLEGDKNIEYPRRAALSSFGAGGSNAHFILEEYISEESEESVKNPPFIFALSAKNELALKRMAQEYVTFLEKNTYTNSDLYSMEYTLLFGREEKEVRFAAYYSNTVELLQCLHNYLNGIEHPCYRVGKKQMGSKKFSTGKKLTNDEVAVLWEEKNIERIIDIWTNGQEIDWNPLFEEGYPKRISLPTYSFEKVSHWFTKTENRVIKLHPFLTRNVSDLSEQKYVCQVTGEESYLKGHELFGKKVLPASAYLEMIREAVAEACQDDDKDNLIIQNVKWMEPFVLNQKLDNIYIGLMLTGESSIYCEIYSITDIAVKIHCQATVGFEPSTQANIDLMAIQEKCTESVFEKKEIYDIFAQKGFVYASEHKILNQISCGKDICMAKVVAEPSSYQTLDSKYLEPGVLDAAIQSFIGLVAQEEDSQRMMPYQLKKMVLLAPLEEELWVVLTRDKKRKEEQIVSMQLCTNSGKVCLTMEGFCYRNMGVGQKDSVTTLFTSHYNRRSLDRTVDSNQYQNKIAVLLSEKTRNIAKLELPDYEIYEIIPQGDRIDNRYEDAATKILRIVKGVMKEHGYEKTLIQTLCIAEKSSLYRGISKLLRTAERENGNVTGQYIELSCCEENEHIESYFIENAKTSDTCICYSEQGRTVQSWKKLKEGITNSNSLWKDEGVYLLTGGISGLAEITMRHIASSVQNATIVLTGRKDLEEVKDVIQQYKELPAKIAYYPVDMTDYNRVCEVVTSILNTYSKIDGVLYGAGILRDCYIIEKNIEEFKMVMAPKIHGIVNLDLATKDCQMDFFVAYSSIAGAIGNAGQVDYSSANAFMDQYMHYRNELVSKKERYGQSFAVNWPLWKDGGMKVDAKIEQIIRKNKGIVPMESETGMKILDCILSNSFEQMLVVESELNSATKAIKSLEINLEETEEIKSENSKAIIKAVEETVDIEDRTVAYLKKIVAETTQLPVAEIKESVDFNDLGMNSIWILEINEKLERDIGGLSKTLLYEHRCIEDLSEYLIANKKGALNKLFSEKNEGKPSTESSTKQVKHEFKNVGHVKSRVSMKEVDKEEIAIVGLAGSYPQAENVEEFWSNLLEGKDCITEIPDGRWSYDKYKKDEKVSYSRYGGFLKEVDKFDPLFFCISPRDAQTMDPQERLFLQCSYHAMQDAGYTRENIAPQTAFCDGANVGVYVGVMNEEYQFLGVEEQMKGNPVTVSGSAAAIANRVSYTFNFQGPSIAIDTMCSSSLTAVYLACEAIRNGECQAAIAGGVNISIHANKYLALGQNYFTSEDGRCRAFGENGKGYVPGEGVGAVVLKSLKNAIKDKDHIYGVIKGGAINHGGKTHGYTVPNPNAQANVIKRALEKAHVNPRTISYVEAHGTGTALGDPIEIAGLTKAYEEATNEKQYCGIGSVKSNIGHCEGASGIASITKVLLQMKHRKLVSSLHAEVLNSNLNLEKTPFYVQRRVQEWKRQKEVIEGIEREIPLRAGVSAFGAGGTNVHLILEEYMEKEATSLETQDRKEIPLIFVLSAKNEWQVEQQANNLLKAIQDGLISEENSYQAAYTLQFGREAMDERVAMLGSTLDDVGSLLKKYVEHISEERIITGHVDTAERMTKKERKVQEEKAAIAFERKDYKQVVSLWMQGGKIDWSLLYEGEFPQKMSLPCYPFEKEVCWLERTTDEIMCRPSGTIQKFAIENVSTLAEQKYVVTLTGQESYFVNHIVGGKKMLPATAYIEIIRMVVTQALSLNSEKQAIKIKNIMWLHPLVAEENKTNKLTISLRLEYKAEEKVVLFRIFKEDDSAIYCKGEVCEVPFVQQNMKRDEIMKDCTKSLHPEDLYKRYEQYSITYKNEHRSVEKLYLGQDVLVAKIDTKQSSEKQSMSLDPAVADCALQSCAGFVLASGEKEEQGRLAIPFKAKEILILDGTQPCMWAVVHRTSLDSSEEYQIDLCKEDGTVCVEMKGLKTKEYKEQDSKNELITHVYYEKTSEVEIMTLEDKEENIIFLCEDAPFDIRNQVKTYQNVYEVRENYTEKDYESILTKVSKVNKILFVMGKNNPSILMKEDFLEKQKSGILQFYRLIKAMDMRLNKNQNCSVCVITYQTVPFLNEEVCDPKNAGMQGIVRTVAVEYPHWDICMCDLDNQFVTPVPFVRDLTLAHNAVLLSRNGVWYRYKLETVKFPVRQDRTVYRNQGVYVMIGGNGGIGEVYSKYLIDTYNATVVWLGRRKVSDVIQDKIDAFSNGIGRVEYYSCDASSLEQLTATYNQLKARHGKINGVIHSAILLADNRISNMEESDFETVYDTKMKICLRMAQVFQNEELDFMLFFSSLQAFSNALGQANYAAGCSMKDAYAKMLSYKLNCDCKVVNWGYWGNQGIVASRKYREKMKRLGVDSIREADAMEFIENLLASPLQQAGYMKINENYKKNPLQSSVELSILPDSSNTTFENIDSVVGLDEQAGQLKPEFEPELEDMIVKMLYVVLTDIGLIHNNRVEKHALDGWLKKVKQYDKWLLGTIHLLQKFNVLQQTKDDFIVNGALDLDVFEIRRKWREETLEWRKNEEISRYTNAIIPVIEKLPAILEGRCKATDVIFPNGSMELVEPIYKYDKTVHFANYKLACYIEEYVRQKSRQGDTVSIFEIGAGTGGTSYQVFKALKPLESYVDEYCYTDLSKAFLSFAEKEYCSEYPFVKLRIYDVSNGCDKDLEGKYDIVFATNVIHATKSISQSIQNMKHLLKPGGIVILNEMVCNSVVTHLIFGLLEGWWLYEDGDIRIEDCPLLSEMNWMAELRKEDFDHVITSKFMSGQELILGKSNGCIRKCDTTVSIENAENAVECTPVKEQKIVKERMIDQGTSFKRKTEDYIKTVLGAELKIDKEKLKGNAQFDTYGLDSIIITKITAELKKQFKSVDNSLFFECQTINEVVGRLLKEEEDALIALFSEETEEQDSEKQVQVETIPAKKETKIKSLEEREEVEDIAIVGLSGKYPKADNLNEFWDNLRNGVDCITEIPKERWDWKKYYNEKKGRENSIYTKWGGFIDGIDKFDPYFFGIVPAEAEKMDPQERLFLQIVYECLEDAGYTPQKLSEQGKVGVYVGAMNGYYSGGISLWSIANRVSYLFDFHGPSFAVDSACSSSMTALCLAVQSIQRKDCESAIVGGVNLVVSPKHFIRLCNMRMLSPGNACRAFGEHADGIVDGEGVGAVLIKPLKNAIDNGDHIYGVIKASELNSGGKTNGYTIPNPKYQAEVIRNAYQKANINPETLSYIEAHGTGTALGDPIEIEAISKVFREYTNKLQFCSIGSVKTNIGHSESAAGIAALTKVLLQLTHRKLVPSLHSERLNEKIDIKETPFYVQHELEDWTNISKITGHVQKRRAGISSFGAGGTNAHIVVEEYISEEERNMNVPKQVVIALSAKSKEQLCKKAAQLNTKLFDYADDSLLDIAYTLLEGRVEMPYRVAFVAATLDEVREKLKLVSERNVVKGIFITDEKVTQLDVDEEAEEWLESIVASEDLAELAKAWVNGYPIEWNRLFLDQKPHRVSLPTYPFETERYWIQESLIEKETENPVLKRLVHKNCCNYKEYRFESWFTGEESFLSGHIVKGKKIVPGAVYLELVRQAVEEFVPSEAKKWCLGDIVWIRALEIESKTKVITEFFVNEDQSIRFEVYTLEEEERKVLHCKGNVLKMQEEELLDFSQIKEELLREESIPGDICYDKFEQLDMEYGIENRVVSCAYVSESKTLLKLELPKVIEESPLDCMVHPNLIDASLQGIFILNMDKDNPETKVPYGIEEISFIKEAETSMWAYIRKNRAAKDESYDVFIFDYNGNLCISLNKVIMKEITTVCSSNQILMEYHFIKQSRSEKDEEKTHFEQKAVIMCDFEKDFVEAVKENLSDTIIYDMQYNEREDEVSYLTRCFDLLKKLVKERKNDQIYIQVILPANKKKLVYAGWIPALRSAKLEIPKLGGQVISVEDTCSVKQLGEILKENYGIADVQKVEYQEGKRLVECLKGQKARKCDKDLSYWKENGVYIIAGGAGGLGRVLIKELSQTLHRGKVIVLGRSYYQKTEFRCYEKPGFTVQYLQADVTDRVLIGQVVSEIEKREGAVNGVFYVAGVIEDSVIVKKELEQCRKVLQAKVAGVQNLEEATKNTGLDFFVIYSSIAGVLGNAGQADYAMANGYLDAFAQYRNTLVREGKRSGITISINWPLWKSGGMLMSGQEQIRFEERTGISPLSDKDGIQCLKDALCQKTERVLYLQGRESVLEQITNRYSETERVLEEKNSTVEESTELDRLIKDVRDGSISEEMFERILREISQRGGLSEEPV